MARWHRTAGLIALGVVLVLPSAGAAPRAPALGAPDPHIIPVLARCFATGVSRVIGVDRICYYRCNVTTITTIAIPATEICPDFIDR
jgi:hypothetical protein